jgi:hypothetical protein
MRESVRPMVKLAIFGTYTLLAIGIAALRGRLREARMPAEQKPTAEQARAVRRRR